MRFSDAWAAVFLLAAVVLAGLAGCGLGGGSVETDREALVVFYHATGGPQWDNNENWLSNKPLDEWYGVGTDNSGRVALLVIPGGNNLSSPIPPELGNLSNLRVLSLNANQLIGAIPPELGNLSNLEKLFLVFNQLTGPIPPELGNLSSLEWLDISYNQLTGAIPPELGNLSNLRVLSLNGNQLIGAIPPELGNLSNLERLSLGDNQLAGPIPPELSNLSNLVTLNLYRNDGVCVPRSISDWYEGIKYNDGDIYCR